MYFMGMGNLASCMFTYHLEADVLCFDMRKCMYIWF